MDGRLWFRIEGSAMSLSSKRTMTDADGERSTWVDRVPVQYQKSYLDLGSVKHVYIVHVLARVLYTRASTCVYVRARTQ